MVAGQPGSNSRGRGGKFRTYTRGGGKHFSRDLRPVDADGNEISMWSADAQPKSIDDSEEEDSEEDSEEESGSDNDGTEQSGALSREERKQAAKARKEAAIAKKKAQAVEVGDLPPSDSEDEDEEITNPNHSRAARVQTNAGVEDVTAGIGDLSTTNRKERETAEAQLAKERYQRLHEQGKTDEAKADLARLQLIREQRAADAARRQAEKEEKLAQEAARRAQFEDREAKKRAAALGGAKKGAKKAK
ncbi:hypothetical protein SODALDRAFT_326900 [Sodiomyces alkalinus F11]|uniref:Casein kinase substrate phosphoprotein PP28 domain-containing protein n=1 Tax=Sodiomyces alkalinus (strain CBS 110278 / VKM F-3762 / F11) TaxID=1314773 RepID=A0A3N2Q7I7_SODAK|nr:hypothetical protein SODALDRAFT_326900 [Sodiomyces alkalinus F11]ROT42741.1 hypothetical protein SODALDRAFT_326900 [Sodiomyces alkalinus F11]